jgi:L-ribulokinase
MCGVKKKTFRPIARNQVVYQKLYVLYRQRHDGFGLQSYSGQMANVMKELLNIKDQANR